MIFFLNVKLCYNHSFVQMCLLIETVFQVINVAHGPLVFSSPELKAQVSFSDHLSSGVCLSVRPSVRPSVCLSVCL